MGTVGLDPYDKYINGERLTHFIEFGEYPPEDEATDAETASSDEENETDEPSDQE